MNKPTPIATGPAKVRKVRTPAERAQDALAVVDRQIKAVHDKITAKRKELTAVEAELLPLERRREYLAANPDLPKKAVFGGVSAQSDE